MTAPPRRNPLAAALALAHARESLPSAIERRRIREAAGVSLTAIAESVGVSRAAVSRWESGQRSPRGQLVFAYRDVLNRLVAEGRALHKDTPPAETDGASKTNGDGVRSDAQYRRS